MRRGVLGGTFDPVHIGHLGAAAAARAALALDQVLFVPAGQPPHKADRVHAGPEQRYRMVSLAVASEPAFRATRIELDRPGPSYTVDTLRLLAAEGLGPLFFICGADALAQITTWHEWQSIPDLAEVVAISRPGAAMSRPLAARVIEGVDFDISSEAVRERVREGRSIEALVPAAVARFIRREGLYRG